MFDFVGEAPKAAAADAAVIVVSGKAGVQVGTQKAWELCEIQSSAYDLRNGNGSGRCQLPRSR